MLTITIIIRPENTAITNGVSSSTKMIIHNYDNSNSILDYGCGKLRNSKKLLENNFNVSILDTEYQIKRIKLEELKQYKEVYISKNLKYSFHIRKYNIVLCSFVLNVIPNEEERINVLNNISKFLLKNGVAYIEVRTNSQILKNKQIQKFNDGYLCGKGNIKTFQKGFTIESLKSLINKSDLEIEEFIKQSNSIIAIVRRRGESLIYDRTNVDKKII